MPGLIKYSCFKTHFISNAKKKKWRGKKEKQVGDLNWIKDPDLITCLQEVQREEQNVIPHHKECGKFQGQTTQTDSLASILRDISISQKRWIDSVTFWWNKPTVNKIETTCVLILKKCCLLGMVAHIYNSNTAGHRQPGLQSQTLSQKKPVFCSKPFLLLWY
jgi:hypothetical protein